MLQAGPVCVSSECVRVCVCVAGGVRVQHVCCVQQLQDAQAAEATPCRMNPSDAFKGRVRGDCGAPLLDLVPCVITLKRYACMALCNPPCHALDLATAMQA